MSQMLKAAGAVASATLVSRVLGLVREMVYARFMGNGWVASAFLLAFQIPNLFRRLLGEGALSAAFIPVFKTKERTEGDESMWRAANAVISGLSVVASVVVALAIVAISLFLQADGLSARTRLMLDLLRLMFPYTVFICLAAVGVGMLNARGRFFVPALGAAVLNLVMIASVLVLAPRWGTELPQQIYALAFGVVVAGLVQAAFQVPSLIRDGWRYRWVNPWREATVAEVVRRMIPTTIGVAAFQLNVLITQGFAFFVGDSIVASFQYAVRLMELPQGLFGASLAAYLLPTLSGLAAEKRHEDFRGALFQGLSHLVLVNLIASVLLVVLAQPIVRLLFEGGLFRASATVTVSRALMCLAPGLVAFSGTNVLARAFYAVGDTRVPMQIAVFCLALNVVISLLFVLPLREAGLGLANTLTSSANVMLLAHALRRKFPKIRYAPLWAEARLVVVVAIGVGLVVWGLSGAWENLIGSEGLLRRLGAVFVPASAGICTYFAVLWWGGVPSCRILLGTMLGRWGKSEQVPGGS